VPVPGLEKAIVVSGKFLGAEEKAEGAGHCKEEDYEEELDQAGLKLRRLTVPFGRGRFQKGLKVLERMPVNPQLEEHYVKSFTRASSIKCVITSITCK
jgi:hypothetical protein